MNATAAALKVYMDDFGARGILIAMLSRLSKLTGWPLTVSVPVSAGHRVFVRLRSTDMMVFKRIFREGEFDIETPKPPRVIVDAGAYTGLSSVYFAVRYPEATILAIEPEESNFRVLARNVRPFPNVIPIRAALWKDVTRLKLYDVSSDGAGNQWAYRVSDKASEGQLKETVATVTVDTIMRDHHIDQIDILKLDIEGAEKDVLEHSARWIDKVHVLVVELHDRFREGCTAALVKAAAAFAHEEIREEKVIRMRAVS